MPLAAPRRGAALTAIALLVIAADQSTKAWAWRHAGLVHINSGSGLLFGDRAGAVYRDGRWGSLIDAGALGAIVLLGAGLARLRLTRPVFAGAALMLAGWASNLGDRIGLHQYTAPGSERGVVDFLRFHGRLWNLADIVIIAGAALCLVAAGPLVRRRRAPLASERWSTASTAPSPGSAPLVARASSPASGPAAHSVRLPT